MPLRGIKLVNGLWNQFKLGELLKTQAAPHVNQKTNPSQVTSHRYKSAEQVLINHLHSSDSTLKLGLYLASMLVYTVLHIYQFRDQISSKAQTLELSINDVFNHFHSIPDENRPEFQILKNAALLALGTYLIRTNLEPLTQVLNPMTPLQSSN